DTDGRVLQANRRAAELLGHSLEEIIGSLTPSFGADTPEGKPRILEVRRKHLAGESVSGWELELRHKDGRPAWIKVWMEPGRRAAAAGGRRGLRGPGGTTPAAPAGGREKPPRPNKKPPPPGEKTGGNKISKKLPPPPPPLRLFLDQAGPPPPPPPPPPAPGEP